MILQFTIALLALCLKLQGLHIPARDDIQSGPLGLNNYSQQMFDESMAWQDTYYDKHVGYLVTADTTLPGRYDTRQTAWYAVGLVARNENDDLDRAARIISNLHTSQYKDPSKIFYGDINQAPEEPTPQDEVYPIEIWSGYDPNWRDFVGSAFILLLSDYKDRLTDTMLSQVEDIVYLMAKGDQYRVAFHNDDLFYPAYSNPWLMRCILQSFTGQYFNDQNMTDSGEHWATEIYDLYLEHDTFSEFNSPTYTGVDIWALGMWMNYAADNSSLPQYADKMFVDLMELFKEMYNANLKNFCGPFSRAYGYDMNQYFAITAASIWGLVGREYAPMPDIIPGMLHIADFGFAHLIALGIPLYENKLSNDVLEAFKTYPGTHSFTRQAYTPADDECVRNITGWSDDLITIGAESFVQHIVGGVSHSQDVFNPAVIQWYVREGRIGYISLYPTQPNIQANAGQGYLDISYPNITEWPGYNPAFTFIISGFDVYPHDNLTSIQDLPGLKLEVSGSVNASSEIFFYDNGAVVNGFVSFNSTWLMPDNFTGVPHIHLDITEYPTSKDVTYKFSDL